MAVSRTVFVGVVNLLCLTQILQAGAAKRSTTASLRTSNGLQDALKSAGQAIDYATNEVSQGLELNSLPEPETVANELHNQTLSFAANELHNQTLSFAANELHNQTLSFAANELHNQTLSFAANELHNQTLSFARTVGQFVGQLQNEISTYHDEFNTLLQSVAASWNETAITLVDQTSQMTRTVQELQTSFISGLQSFFDETKKIANATVLNAQTVSNNLQQLVQTALERVQETTDEFRANLQATTQNTTAH